MVEREGNVLHITARKRYPSAKLSDYGSSQISDKSRLKSTFFATSLAWIRGANESAHYIDLVGGEGAGCRFAVCFSTSMHQNYDNQHLLPYLGHSRIPLFKR
jgi:hypothetical protein